MTSEKNTFRMVCILVLSIAGMFARAVFVIYKICMMYLPAVWAMLRSGNKTAIADFIRSKSRLKGAILLWILFVIQILLVFVPLVPLQIVAGMTYGTIGGTLICLSACISASMLMYFFGSKMNDKVQPLVHSIPKLRNRLETIQNSPNKIVYTITAFLTPGFPNGIIPLAAVNADMDKKTYLTSALIGMPLPAILTCMAGSLAIDGEIGYSILSMAVLFAIDIIILKNRDKIAMKLSDRIKAI